MDSKDFPAPSKRLPPPARWRTNLIIFTLVGFVAILIAAMLLGQQATKDRVNANAWTIHTYEVLEMTADLRYADLSAVVAEKSYMLTGEPAQLAAYYRSIEDADGVLKALMRKVSDNPLQVERLKKIDALLEAHTAQIEYGLTMFARGQREEAIAHNTSETSRRGLEHIVQSVERFEVVEKGLLRLRRIDRERFASDARWYEYLVGIAGVLLLGVGAFAVHALRDLLGRFRQAQIELERTASIDHLTGLANRREALTVLNRQIAISRRYRRPLSLAIVDIDHFKKVNDTFGHPGGDEVLRRVAELSSEIMREHDLVGRLGGEEFIIVLPDADADAAMIACDRLRSTIAATALLLETGQTLSVTLSAGIAQLEPGDNQDALLAKADDALYRAKAAGRDRVLLAA